MEVIEVVRSWVGVATTWMVEVLGLARREDVVELRRRVDELQAIVRGPVDDELPRRATSAFLVLVCILSTASAASIGPPRIAKYAPTTFQRYIDSPSAAETQTSSRRACDRPGMEFSNTSDRGA